MLVQGPGRKLLNRAKGDAIGLAQSTIDGASLGHSHLGVVEDKRRDVARVGVAIAHEPATLGRLVDRGFEDPEVLLRPAQGKHRLGMNAIAVASLGQPQQVAMGHKGA